MSRYSEEIIDPGDRASQLAHEINVASYGNHQSGRVIAHESGNFRGAVSWLWSRKVLYRFLDSSFEPRSCEDNWELAESIGNDGAGGKPQFFTFLGEESLFRGLAWEIIAMCADDFARSGQLPVIMANQLDAKRITDANFPLVKAAFEGYGEALAKARLVGMGGETAVMKHSITAFCDTGENDQFVLTWNGTCLGLTSRQLLFQPQTIKPGMPVVGFWEPLGYRCNGGTFFTNLIRARWASGDTRYLVNNEEARMFVRKLCVPSRSYARFLCKMAGWQDDGVPGDPLVNIRGAAHITGGGLWGKFKEMLPDGVGAVLDNMPELADVLIEAQRISREVDGIESLTDWECYRIFHGGCGMLVVCATGEDATRLIRCSSHFGVDASIVGDTVESSDRELIVYSRFLDRKKLSSERPE